MENKLGEGHLHYQEFLNRENDKRHHTHREDNEQYRLMREGNDDAVTRAAEMFASELPGKVSTDPLRNSKYLFVASCTLASRYAISGGMDDETAYNISDMFILRMDTCVSIDEVRKLHAEMIKFYTDSMKKILGAKTVSVHISKCEDYIDSHLHENIRIADLSALTGLNGSYLSTLFRKETGFSVSDYILRKKAETAKNMLVYSGFSQSEISSFLGFSSQSHFSNVFRKYTGHTPGEYRKLYYSLPEG